jgi:hypothetical protein
VEGEKNINILKKNLEFLVLSWKEWGITKIIPELDIRNSIKCESLWMWNIIHLKLNLILNNDQNYWNLLKIFIFDKQPLRFLYFLEKKIYSSFSKIIKYFDLPYIFDQKSFWRYIANPLGIYYEKGQRNYIITYSMNLKKNFSFFLNSFIKYPNKQIFSKVKDWQTYAIFFFKSLKKLNNFKYNKIFLKNIFFPIKNFHINLISRASNIRYNKFHRIIYLVDSDINPWVSTFDYRFWTYDFLGYIPQKFPSFKLDYFWGAHPYYLNPTFFITSFDTNSFLSTELYFKYKNNLYNILKLFKSKYFFIKKYSIIFYKNIVCLLENFYKKLYLLNLFKLRFFIKFNFIKKFNLQIFLYFFLVFYRILNNNNNNKLILNYNISLIKNRILFRSYYVATRKKKNFQLYFRSNFIKKIPNNIYNYLYNFNGFFNKSLNFRTIYYSNFYIFLKEKFIKFFKYFSIYFLQNIKNRLFNLLFNFNNDILYHYFINLYNIIHKYFLLNKYIFKLKSNFKKYKKIEIKRSFMYKKSYRFNFWKLNYKFFVTKYKNGYISKNLIKNDKNLLSIFNFLSEFESHYKQKKKFHKAYKYYIRSRKYRIKILKKKKKIKKINFFKIYNTYNKKQKINYINDLKLYYIKKKHFIYRDILIKSKKNYFLNFSKKNIYNFNNINNFEEENKLNEKNIEFLKKDLKNLITYSLNIIKWDSIIKNFIYKMVGIYKKEWKPKKSLLYKKKFFYKNFFNKIIGNWILIYYNIFIKICIKELRIYKFTLIEIKKFIKKIFFKLFILKLIKIFKDMKKNSVK